MLNAEKIEEAAGRDGVNRVAVENFLSTLDGGTTYQEAVANCEMDARSYGWTRETSGAIRECLVEYYFR